MSAYWLAATIDWYRESEPLPHLAVVASAVWDERPVAIHYESWKLTSRRTIHPLGLVLKAGAWYLVAASAEQVRTYRVSNILQAELLEGAIRRPKGFELAAYWRESVRRFESQLIQGEAIVRANAAGLKALSHLSAAVAKAVASADRPGDDDQRVQLRIPVESIDHATGQLLWLAPDVEVVGPPALRRSTLDRLKKLVALYGV